MPKQLRLDKVTSRDGLTVRELKAWLAQYTDENVPVVLRCGRNFRLGKMLTSVKTAGPVLIGNRAALK